MTHSQLTTYRWPLATGHWRLPARPAFTLVEMLIAMVLTLILVTAIAQFYAIVGESVKDGRATIEMGGQLRAAVERLKSDLDLITVPLVPWTDDGAASGYFEYFEGIGNDYKPDGSTDISLPASVATLAANSVTNTIGDGDDFLAFTIRTDGAPFTGRYTAPTGVTPAIITSSIPNLAATPTPTIATSQLAEVIWWVGFDDLNSNSAWNFDEPRMLFRRQLLIRPELGQIGGNYTPADFAHLQQAQQDLMRFWQYNDISASIRAEFSGSTPVYRIRANSLGDLTKRENRFAHMPMEVKTANGPNNSYYFQDQWFPHSAVTQGSSPSPVVLLLPCFSVKSPNTNALTSYALQAVNGVGGESPGEDIILSNLLAFDVQVYDPYARIWPDNPAAVNTSTTALVPSDPGYSTAATSASGITPPPLVGLGAFVDLNYYRYLTNAAIAIDNTMANPSGSNITAPYFGAWNKQDNTTTRPSFPPNIAANAAALTQYFNNFGYYNSGLYASTYGATYDTWALSYERDGVDQLAINSNGLFDLQTNGLDDDGANGVDDVNERDTIPPYSQPLRGLRVRIRLYEPSTRQVRQATVAADFINE